MSWWQACSAARRRRKETPIPACGEHLHALVEEGVQDREIEQLLQFCAAFHVISRISDALRFDIPSDEEFRRGGAFMLTRGYR